MRQLFIPTVIIALLTAALFRSTYLFQKSALRRLALIILAAVLAVPALLFSSNYILLIPNAEWFIDFHALTAVEITSGLIGAIFGIICASSKLRPNKLNRPVVILSAICCLGLLFAPFAKQIIFSIQFPTLRNEWKNGVCMQTSGNTCVIASTATVMYMLGKKITEPELARKAGVTYEGIETWYYIRALRRLGFEPQFGHLNSLKNTPVPSVVGVKYTSRGHAIAVLSRDEKGIEIGDPMFGRRLYKWSNLPKYYEPNGMCITLCQTSHSH